MVRIRLEARKIMPHLKQNVISLLNNFVSNVNIFEYSYSNICNLNNINTNYYADAQAL